jgi:ribosomal protein L11 methyltransferase
LDLGTGSGILAIAAAKLDAQRVVAADIDPVALETAEENVRANAASATVTVVNGDDAWRLGSYDMVLANLTAEDLQALLPRIDTVLAPKGCALLSGILISREGIMADAINRAGLRVAERRESGEWIALTVTRPDSL